MDHPGTQMKDIKVCMQFNQQNRNLGKIGHCMSALYEVVQYIYYVVCCNLFTNFNYLKYNPKIPSLAGNDSYGRDTIFPNTIIPNERSCNNLQCKADEENSYNNSTSGQQSKKSYVECVWTESIHCQCNIRVQWAIENCRGDFDGNLVCETIARREVTGLASTLKRPTRN